MNNGCFKSSSSVPRGLALARAHRHRSTSTHRLYARLLLPKRGYFDILQMCSWCLMGEPKSIHFFCLSWAGRGGSMLRKGQSNTWILG